MATCWTSLRRWQGSTTRSSRRPSSSPRRVARACATCAACGRFMRCMRAWQALARCTAAALARPHATLPETADWCQPYIHLAHGALAGSSLWQAGLGARSGGGSLCAQLAEALAYMHGKAVMHRDIKAENMVFRDSAAAAAAAKIPPQVKIIDLGMAAMYDPAKPVHGARPLLS